MNEEQNEEKIPVKSEGKIYKIGFFILFSIFLLAIGALGSWFFMFQQASSDRVGATPTITSTKVSPKPTSSEDQQKQDNTPPQEEEKTDLEKITEAMAARHSKNTSDTTITISKNTTTHVSGGVRFEGEMGGGWFLAATRNGEWVIVDDGNGTVSCEVIEPWNFPSDMVPECVDEVGNVQSR